MAQREDRYTTFTKFLNSNFNLLGPNDTQFVVRVRDLYRYYDVWCAERGTRSACFNDFSKMMTKTLGKGRRKALPLKIKIGDIFGKQSILVFVGLSLKNETYRLCKLCFYIKHKQEFNPVVSKIHWYCKDCRPNLKWEDKSPYIHVVEETRHKAHPKRVQCLGYCNKEFTSYSGERVCPACKNTQKTIFTGY